MIKNLIKYIIIKLKYRNACKFDISSNISIKSTFEGPCKIHHHTTFHGHLGLGSYIGNNCSLSAQIGRFTSIGPHVRSNSAIHPYKSPFVTTSPCFFSKEMYKKQSGFTFAQKQFFKEFRNFDEINGIAIKIGSDCWIGEGAFFTGGIVVSDGAMVLAHAVVTKDVPPYAIVGGVPAKIIGYRYDNETIQFLLKTQWWNKPVHWLKKNWILFSDLEEFKKSIILNNSLENS